MLLENLPDNLRHNFVIAVHEALDEYPEDIEVEDFADYGKFVYGNVVINVVLEKPTVVA